MELKIKFQLNKELDKQMAYVFLSRSSKKGGVDFSKSITHFHPELEKAKRESDEERKKIIDIYFDKYYKEHLEELEKKVIEAEKQWEKTEEKFIEQVNKIFKNPGLPNGKYIGYVSVINCNPRFLDNKTFQFFYKHGSGSNMIAAHEILHFFFYDYAIKKYPSIFGELDTNKGIFWNLAELFNYVILSLPEFIEIHGDKNTKGYPDHEQHIDYMKKLWNNKPDIDNWLLEAHGYLNNIK